MVPVLTNISRGCRCRQSTIDPSVQKNLDGATAAVNCARTGDASFFTLSEKNPWWEIDLGRPCAIDCITVYNWDRTDVPFAEGGRSRARFMQVWGSEDGSEWRLLHDRRVRNQPTRDFGGVANGPLYVGINQDNLQFIRLTLASGGILHLNSVQIYAQGEAEQDQALLDMFLYANELSTRVAGRIFAGLDIPASDLTAHAQRLGVTLGRYGVMFVASCLMEAGRVSEAEACMTSLLPQAVTTGAAAGATDADAGAAGLFDTAPGVSQDDPHYWISVLPAYVNGEFGWIDQAFRFASRTQTKLLDRRAPVLYDQSPGQGKRIFFCGGCEFSYAGFFLRLRGYDILNTFLDNRASDPVAQFLGFADNAALVQFKPDLIILSMEQVFKQFLLKTFAMSDYGRSEQLADLANLIKSFDQAIKAVRRLCPDSKVCLLSHIAYSGRQMHMFEESTFANMPGDPLTIAEFGRHYDLALMQLARQHAVLLLDFEEMMSKFGKSSACGRIDHVRPDDYLGGHPEMVGARVLANTVDGWVATLFPATPKIKLMVLDLDNTMWDGVYREDGLEFVTAGIRTAHCYAALFLAEQGMLLALCSKNNPEAADELKGALESKFPGLGRKVVAMRINWLPKSENIKSIVRELNIGMDTVAFFDDQPFERAEVAAALPQLRVYTDADLLQVGRYAPFLPVAPISNESRGRATSYLTEQVRREEESNFAGGDYADFLVSCQFELVCRRGTAFDVTRIAEIFQRTNQQNITLRRTSKEFLESALHEPRWQVWCCELSDKFGDYGMIGAILVDCMQADRPQFVELAFSCRAMGKGLEKAFLQRAAEVYRLAGASSVSVPIKKTDKNQAMIDIVKSAGLIEAGEDCLLLDLMAITTAPEFDRWVNWRDGGNDGGNDGDNLGGNDGDKGEGIAANNAADSRPAVTLASEPERDAA